MSEYLLDRITMAISDISENLRRMQDVSTSPCAIFKPKFGVDGNQFYFLLGDDLQSGIAGFGETPQLASDDFDKNFLTFKLKK